jgi:DNA-directed RNA polymerase subunit E'/Rpb7
MDPLFERRVLTRNIHLDAKFLQRNIQASLLAQLRMKYEGVCVAEGYIQRQPASAPPSLTIVEYSLGRTNLIKGGMDYMVKFQADVSMPHPGQKFRAPVVLKSKIGIHAEVTPLKVLLPRDLHIGNADFDDIQEGQDVEFEVIGSRFQQGDDSIVVLAKLLQIIKPAPPSEERAEASEPLIAASVGGPSEQSEKRVVTVEVSSTKTSEGGPRRVRIKAKAPTNTNESQPQGNS